MIEALVLAVVAAAIDVTIQDLQHSPMAYNGKAVRVRGMLRLQHHVGPVLCAENVAMDQGPCVGVSFDNFSESQDGFGVFDIAKAFNWATVTVTARVDAACFSPKALCLDFPSLLRTAQIKAVGRRQTSAAVRVPGETLSKPSPEDEAGMIQAYKAERWPEADNTAWMTFMVTSSGEPSGGLFCVSRTGAPLETWPMSSAAVYSPSVVDPYQCWFSRQVDGRWRIVLR